MHALAIVQALLRGPESTENVVGARLELNPAAGLSVYRPLISLLPPHGTLMGWSQFTLSQLPSTTA